MREDWSSVFLAAPAEERMPRIAMLWNILAEKDSNGQVKFSDEQVRFNYRPHITLAVVASTTERDCRISQA
jgi:hypothetical protein